MKHHKTFSFFLATFVLYSCGGGGGGGSNTSNPVTTSNPLATINITTSDSEEIDVGSSFEFSWSTSNASSCSASGDWDGNIDKAGNHSTNLDNPGLYNFVINCLNADGKSSSKSISVTANYLLISGTIFDNNNSNRSVYIDQNFNGIKDNFEHSGISNANGFYQIRSLQDIDCLKSFPVRVNNSHLASINPLNDNKNVNISSITSLWSSLSFLNIGRHSWDFYNKTDPCDLFNVMENNILKSQFYRAHERQKVATNLSYEMMNQGLNNTSHNSLSDLSRYEDLNNFYNSLEQIKQKLIVSTEEALENWYKDTDVTLNDIDIKTTSLIDYSNIVIFLNDNNYPSSLSDVAINPGSYQVGSIDNVSLKASLTLLTDPKQKAEAEWLNGWNELYLMNLGYFYIDNKSNIMTSTSDCYVNFSVLCKNDLNGDFLLMSNPPFKYNIISTLQKETAKGLEEIYNKETFFPTGECYIEADYIIRDVTPSNLYTIYSFNNIWSGMQTDSEGDCFRYSYQNFYKYVTKLSLYEDGSYFYLSLDDNLIDSLDDVFEITSMDEYYTPPSQIDSQYISIFNNIPEFFDMSNSEYDMDTDSKVGLVAANIYSYVTSSIQSGEVDSSYVYLEAGNANSGWVSVVFEAWPTRPNYWYSSCSLNGETLVNSDEQTYESDAWLNAVMVLNACLYYQIDDTKVFSRKSTHNSLKENQTISPYNGIINDYQSTPNAIKERDLLMQDRIKRFKKD